MSKTINTLKPEISNELQLEALLSRSQLNEHQRKCASRLIKGVDFDYFQALVKTHRVWPCVSRNLKAHFSSQFPEAQLIQLASSSEKTARRNRHLFVALSGLLLSFKQAGIDVRVLKGIPLAQKLYGDVSKRHLNDIDLIVRKSDVNAAHTLMSTLGYQNDGFAKLPRCKEHAYFCRQKDIEYLGSNGVSVELHVRLQSYSSLLTKHLTEDFVQGGPASEDLFIYLCWHATASFHHRLKWLTDIVLFVEKEEMCWDKIRKRADELDAIRSVRVSLLLVSLLYESETAQMLTDKFAPSKVELKIVKLCLRNLSSEVEFQGLPKFYQRKSIREYMLSKTLSNRFAIFIQIFKPGIDQLNLLPTLPHSLRGLYYLARPLSPLVLLFNRFKREV